MSTSISECFPSPKITPMTCLQVAPATSTLYHSVSRRLGLSHYVRVRGRYSRCTDVFNDVLAPADAETCL